MVFPELIPGVRNKIISQLPRAILQNLCYGNIIQELIYI